MSQPRPFYCLTRPLGTSARRLAAQLANHANGAAMMALPPLERAQAFRECAALLLGWAMQTEVVEAAQGAQKGPAQ